MIAFLFPGQGSQKRGMGQDLFDEIPEFVAAEKSVDDLLGYSLRKQCLEDVGNRLKETEYTQPSLYVVNALHTYKALRQGMSPAFLAGHSLGEYNALLVAGAFDFLTGLRLVKLRGELMSRAKNGGMGAVIGMRATQVSRVLADNGITSIDIANYNSPSQTIVSGPLADIRRVGSACEAAGARMFIPLQVSAAFHSRYMIEAAKAFSESLAALTFHPPQIPVIANATALPYPTDDGSDGIKRLLVSQFTQSVQWTQSVSYLIQHRVQEFKEMGPGNVLTRLVQQIQIEHDCE